MVSRTDMMTALKPGRGVSTWRISSLLGVADVVLFLLYQDNIVGCKAFMSTPLEIAGAALANVFQEVSPCLHYL